MPQDARFEDGGERPLRLRAQDADDLGVLSSLVQDAVFPANEMTWQKGRRRFAILLNRFRRERETPGPERVRSVLAIDDALSVATQGFDRKDADLVLSILAMEFEPGEDGTGRIVLTLAGDGAIGITVETIDVTLQDVTRPYRAPSGKAPEHPE